MPCRTSTESMYHFPKLSVFFVRKILHYVPFWRREGILLCTCRSVGRSVCLSILLLPFYFRSITRERLDLPCPHILGSRGTLLISGSKVKVTGVNCTISDKKLKNALTYLPQTGPHNRPGGGGGKVEAEEPY